MEQYRSCDICESRIFARDSCSLCKEKFEKLKTQLASVRLSYELTLEELSLLKDDSIRLANSVFKMNNLPIKILRDVKKFLVKYEKDENYEE